MESIAALDFGTVIAFLLPGFVAFYSLAYFSPRALQVIDAALTKDAGVGVLFVLLLSSLASGVVVGAIRSLFLDWFQFKTGLARPKLDYSKLANKDTLAAFKSAITNTYRFAQFHGNMFVSMLALVAVRSWPRIVHGTTADIGVLDVILLGTVIILFFAHRSALNQTYQTLRKLIPGGNGRDKEEVASKEAEDRKEKGKEKEGQEDDREGDHVEKEGGQAPRSQHGYSP